MGGILGVSAVGTWARTTGYFKRSRWAGKRSLDGTDVVDGDATDALVYAVATGPRMQEPARPTSRPWKLISTVHTQPKATNVRDPGPYRHRNGPAVRPDAVRRRTDRSVGDHPRHKDAPNSFTPRTG